MDPTEGQGRMSVPTASRRTASYRVPDEVMEKS